MTTPQYKPLGLKEVCEIRDAVESAYISMPERIKDYVDLLVKADSERGFDPSDVRQAAEEALANLR